MRYKWLWVTGKTVTTKHVILSSKTPDTILTERTTRIYRYGYLGAITQDQTRKSINYRNHGQIFKTIASCICCNNNNVTCRRDIYRSLGSADRHMKLRLMENGMQGLRMIFMATWTFLETRQLKTRTCHSRTIGQSEWYNKTILLCLLWFHQYNCQHQTDWDTCFQQ